MASWWRPGLGVPAFGIGCLVLAAIAYLAFEEPVDATLAFALGSVGLFTLLVLTERAIPARTAQASLVGAGRALNEAAEGLALEGRASTVPPGGNLSRDRLFLAAAQSAKPLPVLDDRTILYAGPSTVRIGVAIEPPGRELVERWEQATGRRFADTPFAALRSSLAGMGLSEGLYRDLRLREEKGRLSLSYRPLDVKPPCMDAAATERLPCERTACTLCSAACVALARTLGRPVTVAEAEVAGGEVVLTVDPEAAE